MPDPPLDVDRQRVAWWLVGLALLAVVGVFLVTFVDVFVLGLFVYYGARPVLRRALDHVDSRGWAAGLTVLVIVVPVLLLFSYVVAVAVREFTAAAGPGLTQQVVSRLPTRPESLVEAVRDPVAFLVSLERTEQLRQRLAAGLNTLGVVTTAVVHLTLALAFAFFLLRDGGRVERWFRRQLAGDGTVPYAYLSAVDADLETVYFGNVVTVLLVTVSSVVVYNAYDLLAPAPVGLPFPTLLALLTGIATFIPLVVGKVVYLPVTAYLGWEAVRADAGLLWAPLTFLVVAFLVLDFVPQAVLRPYISGRELHTGLVLFGYVLGAAFFGWYGLFLGPLLVVLVVQFVKIVLPELAHGDRLTPTPSRFLHLGHDPEEGFEGDHGRAGIDADEDEGDGPPVRPDGEDGSDSPGGGDDADA